MIDYALTFAGSLRNCGNPFVYDVIGSVMAA